MSAPNRTKRDLRTTETSKDSVARKNEKIMQSYYDAIIKDESKIGTNKQFNHKPFCLDM